MDDCDAALDYATQEIATLLATAYLRLQIPPQKQVDSPETESVHDSAG